MYELTDAQMRAINGGGYLKYTIIALFGAAFYRLWKSKKGRISIPRLISVEWGE